MRTCDGDICLVVVDLGLVENLGKFGADVAREKGKEVQEREGEYAYVVGGLTEYLSTMRTCWVGVSRGVNFGPRYARIPMAPPQAVRGARRARASRYSVRLGTSVSNSGIDRCGGRTKDDGGGLCGRHGRCVG